MSDKSRRTRTLAVVALVAALVAAIIGVAPMLSSGGSGDSEEPASATEVAPSEEGEDPLAALARRDEGDPLAMGDVDAPVVLVNFSEFQCPYCGKFAAETEPVLIEEYVDEGLLRMEWRDFPYLGEESTRAAHAGRAAAAQDEFWTYHDALFDEQPAPNTGKWTEDALVEVAGEVGLDTDQFREDINSEETFNAVQADFTEGQQIGVTGTPAFLVNGQPIIGAQPTKVFRQAIDSALEEAEQEGQGE